MTNAAGASTLQVDSVRMSCWHSKKSRLPLVGSLRGISNRFHFATRGMVDVEKASTILIKLVYSH